MMREFVIAFIGWFGTIPSNETTINVYVDRLITLVAKWRRQYLVKVISTYGEVRGGRMVRWRRSC